MEVKEIQKYSNRSLSWLKKKAQDLFNAFVRKRDENETCISCDKFHSYPFWHCGHYYNVGSFPWLRFHPINGNKQCCQCNTHKHGNLIEYRKGLIKRYGEEKVKELDDLAAMGKRGFKYDRFSLIETILKYK